MVNSSAAVKLHDSTVWNPLSIQDAIEIKNQLGQEASYISGGTLLQIQWMNGRQVPKHLINLEKIDLLKEIKLQEQMLLIGSLVSLTNCRNNQTVNLANPTLSDALKHIAAPAVRNRATVGGNIMGQVGDLIPLLLALESKLLFENNVGMNSVPLEDWVRNEQNYADLLLKQIQIPLTDQEVFFKKIGRREAFIPAIVTVAGKVAINNGTLIQQVRLAVGGGDNQPVRLMETENYLMNKRLEEIDFKSVYQSICLEFSPVSDAFITADYRRKVAANLILVELSEIFRAYE